MDVSIARRAVALYVRHCGTRRPRVKFFGGEPLMAFGLVREIVETFPREPGRPAPEFQLPTNGTLIDAEVLRFLAEYPEVEAAVSRIQDPRLLAAVNLCAVLCVEPGRASDLGNRLAALLAAGVRKLNVLPAYFVRWEEEQLRDLARALCLAAELIRRCAGRGLDVEVRNLSVSNPAPLFNPGWAVDVAGEVFSSNAAFAAPFSGLRARLRLGHVRDGCLAPPRGPDAGEWDALLRGSLDVDVYRSTRRVDALLSGFVATLRADAEQVHA